MKRDKASLDIFWLRDDSTEDSANLPPPDLIAVEIVEDLRAALEQLEEIAADLSSETSIWAVARHYGRLAPLFAYALG